MIKRLLSLTFITLLLSACAIAPSQKGQFNPRVEIAKGQWVTLLTPAALQLNRNVTQLLSARYKIKQQIKTQTTQVQVEASPRRIVMVAVATWGPTVFSIDYDGATIKTSTLPMPDAALGVTHVLSNFILTYANPSVINRMLKPTAIHAVYSSRARTFYLHHKPIIKIRYQNKNPWRSTIVLENTWHHYSITIKPA